MKSNYMTCPGDACPLRMTCQRHQAWLSRDDDEESEMNPDYHEGECVFYEQKDYFYGG